MGKCVWICTHQYIANPVGYCRYHKCYMNVKRIKVKECLSKKNTGKKCRHLIKFKEHDYWISREKKRRKREEK